MKTLVRRIAFFAAEHREPMLDEKNSKFARDFHVGIQVKQVAIHPSIDQRLPPYQKRVVPFIGPVRAVERACANPKNRQNEAELGHAPKPAQAR